MSDRFFSIFSLLTFLCSGLQGSEVDSLFQIWEDMSLSDSIRFEAYHDIIRESYVFTNPDTALGMAESLYEEANKRNNLYWQAKALILKGNCYTVQSRCKEGVDFYLASIEKFQEADYVAGMAEAYNNIGICDHFAGDYMGAINNYQRAQQIAEEYEVQNRVKWGNLGNLSKLYEEFGDYDQALQYINQVLNLAEDAHVIAGTYHSLSTIYSKLNDYEKAEKNINLSIEKGENINYDVGLAFAYLDKGRLKIKLQDFSEAEEALFSAQQLYVKLRNDQYLASTYAQLGILYAYMNQSEKGIGYCNKAKEIIGEQKLLNVQSEICECTYRNQINLNDYQGALSSHIKLTQLQDSLLNTDKIRIAAQSAMRHMFNSERESIQAEQQRKLLKAELAQSRTKIVGYWIIGILLSIILLFLYYNKIRTDRHNQKLQEKNTALLLKNRELERFAFITSHDLREPVRNISAFSDLLQRKIQDPESKEYLSFIKSSTSKMYKLIDSILSFAKISSKKGVFEEVDLNEVLDDVQLNLHQRIQQNRVKLSYTTLPKIFGGKSQLTILFQNIIDNAIKHNNKERPEINIRWEESSSFYTFEIQDNGNGIEASYFDKIFEPFSRLSNNEGSGLGLSIAKNIVKHHDGKIWVESELGQGTSFFFAVCKDLKVNDKERTQLAGA